MEENWKKLQLLTLLATVEDKNKRREIVKLSGISIIDFLRHDTSCIFGRYIIEEKCYNYEVMKMKMNDLYKDLPESLFKQELMEAFRIMEINYVFQMHAYKSIKKEPFIVGFKRHFSQNTLPEATEWIKLIQERNVIIPFDTENLFTEDNIFWIEKVWGL
jgi:hypothetical protein